MPPQSFSGLFLSPMCTWREERGVQPPTRQGSVVAVMVVVIAASTCMCGVQSRPAVFSASPRCQNADNPIHFRIHGKALGDGNGAVFLTHRGHTTELRGVAADSADSYLDFHADPGQVPNGASYFVRVGAAGAPQEDISFSVPEVQLFLGNSTAPSALKVFPTVARAGDPITVVGENFMPVPPAPKGSGTDPMQVSVVSCDQDAPLWEESQHFTYWDHAPHGLNEPSIAAFCPNQCNNHGTCNQTGQYCSCFPGYDGPDCAHEFHECYQNCTGHGVCDEGACICDDGYIGADCSIFSSLDISHPCIIYQNCTKGDMIRYHMDLFPSPEFLVATHEPNVDTPTVETSHGKEPYGDVSKPDPVPRTDGGVPKSVEDDGTGAATPASTSQG